MGIILAALGINIICALAPCIRDAYYIFYRLPRDLKKKD